MADPSMFGGGQSWDLGEHLFHTTAGTTNFTPPDDPDFSAIASLSTDGINEWVQLNTWLSGGGGSGTAATETYWFHGNPDLIGTEVDFIRLVIHDLSITPINGGTQLFENYTWEVWGHPIFVAFQPPTDPNGTYLIDRRYTNVNVSLAEPGVAVLEWNGTNVSMVGSGRNWRLNISGLMNGLYTYRVWATNSTGAVFVSQARRLTVGVGIWLVRNATYGFFPSMSFDANGSLHVCFYGGDIGPITGLVYGIFNSNGWRFTQVEGTLGSTGQSCSIALDRLGRPHISYIGGPDYYGTFTVRHASYDGASWHLETIDQGYYTYTSIALDPTSNLPRIAYAPYSRGLILASFNGTGWRTEVVDPAVDGGALSLAVDSGGHPKIAYISSTRGALRYAQWTGSAWNLSTVDHEAYTPSLRLDANGGPHVAYLTDTGVKYASLNGTTWSNETFDVKTFSAVALALDSTGAPHVAYATGWGGDVRYAVKNGTWTIQVVAHAYGGNGLAMSLGPGGTPGILFLTNVSNGDLVYATIGIDTIAPFTTIQMTGTPGTAGWFRSSVHVALVATDDVAVRNTTYRIDEGVWQNYTGPFNVSGNGNHTIDYYSTDDAGNSEVTKKASLRIDSVVPVVTVQMAGILGRAGWYRSPVNVTLLANDTTSGVANVLYRVDSGSWIAYSGPFTVSGDGWHDVGYDAVDAAGNRAVPSTVLLKIDSTPPSSSISVSGTVGASGWYTTPSSVALTATDTVIGVVSTSYSLDGGAWQNYSRPLVIAEGRHVFSYRAEDAAGNLEAIHSVAINVDATPPTATITSPSAQTIVGSNVTLTWTAADATSGIDRFEVSLDGGSPSILDAAVRSYTVSGLSEGSHTIKLRAVDVAGNTASTARVLTVDGTSPVVSIASPENGGVVTSSSATVTWTASDPGSGLDHVSIALDGGVGTVLPPNATSRAFTNLADGTHIVKVQAVDRAGNGATSTITFRVDTGILSPSGPYGVSALVGVMAAIVSATLGGVILIRRRRGRPPQGAP